MAQKKKAEVNVDALDFKTLLEESVACSRLGRTIASFGSTLTGREKNSAKFVYLLLKASKPLPERTPTTATIITDKKSQNFTYAQAVKWFSEKYPKEAEPLLKKLKESYDKTETLVAYGLQKEKDLPDDYYIKVLTEVLQIPLQDAAVMYHGSIKPQFERMKEEEGLVKLLMK